MDKSTAALLLLLVFPQVAAYRSKAQLGGEQDSLGLVQADEKEQGDKAWYCPSICIPCADGRRSVMVSRERGVGKFLDTFAVAGFVGLSIVFTPWILVGLPAYVGLKAYTDTLANECPNIELVFFDKNETGLYGAVPGVKRFDPERLKAMLVKDEYLQLFQKNLDRVFTAEKAAKEGRDVGAFENMITSRLTSGREQHQLPDSLLSYVVSNDLFCQDFGEDVGNIMVEDFGEVAAGAVSGGGWKMLFKSCAETVAVETKRCCCKGSAQSPESMECTLMYEDELKKSWNPVKWGDLVCPSEKGYRHYDRFGFTKLPDGCLE